MNATAKLIVAAIDNALAAQDQGADYFKRPQGSHVTWLREMNPSEEGAAAARMLKGLAADGLFEDVTEHAKEVGVAFGACRYFRATSKDNGLKEAVALLSELTPQELAQVRVRIGHHNKLELVSPDIAPRDTDVLHVIVGCAGNPNEAPSEETATVYSWYPGRITSNRVLEACTVKLG